MAKKGGKLSRTEVIPVRFDPMLKMAVELAAAHERRPMGSLVEFVVSRAMNDWVVVTKRGQDVTAWEIVEKCWHPDPIWRLVRLQYEYPETLTFDERNCWQAIALMVSIEQNLAPKQPVGGYMVDVEWLPAMHQVWSYVLENSSNLDMNEVRIRYLQARENLE